MENDLPTIQDKRNSHPLALVYLFLGGLGLLLTALGIYTFYQNQQLSEKVDSLQNQISTMKAALSTPTPSPQATLEERGINADVVAMRYQTIESTWQDNGIAYSAEKIYVTPDIADAGDWRNNYDIPQINQFVVVEIAVRDRRTSGERRSVEVDKYLRLKALDIEQSPKNTLALYLNPQEEGKYFAIFILDKHVEQFDLLSGIQSSPRVTTIDLNASETRTVQGVFLSNEGPVYQYPTQ